MILYAVAQDSTEWDETTDSINHKNTRTREDARFGHCQNPDTRLEGKPTGYSEAACWQNTTGQSASIIPVRPLRAKGTLCISLCASPSPPLNLDGQLQAMDDKWWMV
eukprot:6059254-Lingulodinium_polyedra.AAC.1